MKIIVRTPNWLGDAVMSLPALSAIAASGDEVSLLTLEKLAPFYRIAMPGLDVLTMKRSGFLSNIAVAGKMRARGYDRAILMTNSFSSALLIWTAGIRERIGYKSEGRAFLLSSVVDYPAGEREKHLAEEYLELVVAAGYEGLPHEPLRGLYAWRKKNIGEMSGLSRLGLTRVVLAPGATFGPAKRWPLRSFIELGQKLVRQPGTRIVVTGSREEKELCRKLAREIGDRALSVAGETDLNELMRLLGHCSLVVCNDSGTMHLAAALGCRVLAIFGSSNPRWTAPLGRKTKILKRAYDCSPCYKRKCDRKYVCLTSISADDAFTAAKHELLGRG